MPEKEEKAELVDRGKNGNATRREEAGGEGGESAEAGGGESGRQSADEGEDGEGREEMEGEEGEKPRKMSRSFGVKSYLHQFYTPQPVDDPGLYEFPQVNMENYDAADEKQRKALHGKIFIATIIVGMFLSIISGILLSFQYIAPYIWFKMNDKFPEVEMWILSGLLGGLLLIVIAILKQLILSGLDSYKAKENTVVNGKKDGFQTPGLEGNIPRIKEIQAIQPPQESIMSSMQ